MMTPATANTYMIDRLTVTYIQTLSMHQEINSLGRRKKEEVTWSELATTLLTKINSLLVHE
jgi:hypothetical protein